MAAFSANPRLSAPVAAAEALSSDIYIKTPTQTFNSRYYYALHKGRIWSKPNAQSTGQQAPWALMGCEGLPCAPDKPDFIVPADISEISADGDELTVIASNGQFYARTSAGEGLFSKDEWIIHHGMPKAELALPQALSDKRVMSMGRRNADVMWHEDPDGNVHHYGTMGTSSIYLLAANGHEIHYTDNGLPTDFSHQVCGPERGAFVAENLQASASTLFVINAAGEMYTHMNDFDLNGGTSMFIDYTYTPQPLRPDDQGTSIRTHFTPWRLPLLDWQKQAAIPLTGQARLSSAITILQTGHGNAARELRVAGQNAAGQTGYWFKGIAESRWDFNAVPLQIEPATWLDPTRPAPRVKTHDLVYVQTNAQPGAAHIELLNFNLHCSPATLRIVWPDQRQLDLTLHTVDAWTDALRKAPGRDGTPLLFMGTLEIPPQALASLPAFLQKLNLKTFGFQVAATSDNVALFNSERDDVYLLKRRSPIPESMTSFDYRNKTPIGPYTAGAFLAKNEDFLTLLDTSQLGGTRLLAWDMESFTVADLPQLEALIAVNRDYLKQYEAAHALILSAWQEGWLQSIVTQSIGRLSNLILADKWLPYGRPVTRTAPELMWAYYTVEDSFNKPVRFEYGWIIDRLKSRIARYETRRDELQQEIKAQQD